MFALTVVAVLTACSGGATSVPNPSRATPAPVSAVSPSANGSTSARFTITLPAKPASNARIRRPQYISNSTQSVVITLVSVDGTSYGGSQESIAANFDSDDVDDPNCTGTPPTCIVVAPAVAGNDVFVVATYDAKQTVRSPVFPSGNLLSRASLSVAVIGGQANTVSTPLVLSGVVSSLALSFSPADARIGTAETVALIANALDADGNVIVGNYTDVAGNALALHFTDSDATGATTVSPSSVTSSSTAVTLVYNGSIIPPPTISATFAGASSSSPAVSSSITFAPSAVLTSLSQRTWVASSVQTSFTETITGANFSAKTAGVTVSGNGITVTSATVQSDTSILATLTVAANTPPGIFNVAVTTNDPPETSAPLPLKLETGSIVTSNLDLAPGSPPGTGTGVKGDLRYAIANGAPGDDIVFSCGSPCTIALAGSLPPIVRDVLIDGGSTTTIDGASSFRAFFVDSGNATIESLMIQNVRAKGGDGGPGAGGGLGAGAAIFVNQASADLTVDTVTISQASAVGGNGGNLGDHGGGAGGGLAGNGGTFPGAGGGGVLGNGMDAPSDSGGAGGAGGGALGGGAGSASGIGGIAAIGYATDAGGTAGGDRPPPSGETVYGANGGNGGFGAGSGGGGFSSQAFGPNGYIGSDGLAGNGGQAGFGGGAGAGGDCDCANAGGGKPGVAGAGGGAAAGGLNSPASSGGTGGVIGYELGFPIAGGPASSTEGGGGAAVGPAIFVAFGTLTTVNTTVSNVSASGGGDFFSEGSADSTPVFGYDATIDGQHVTGPAPDAVPSSAVKRSAPRIKNAAMGRR